MEAAWPPRLATCDSLELWVLLNTALKTHRTKNARQKPPPMDSGALTQMLEVGLKPLKTIPKPPKAVIKQASTKGLKNEMPGTPL